MKLLPFLSVVLICSSCFNQKSKEINSNEIEIKSEQLQDTISVFNFSQLEPLLYTIGDKIVVVNFWAMWCAPCVKELPYYKALAEKNLDVELLLVSLDFKEDGNKKLKAFLKEKGITSKVVLLDDPDANSWIDKIDSNWSGAIPFTIIFNKNKRGYYEREFTSVADLEKEINKFK